MVLWCPDWPVRAAAAEAGIDPTVPPGYENLSCTVHIKGSGTKEEFAEIHEAVMATSPNFFNIAKPVTLNPTLVVG